MRILLIENDPTIGTTVLRGLKSEGYAVDWVRDGDEARAALSERLNEFQIALLLVKPFELRELKGRVRALTRRLSGPVEPVLRTRELTLDPATRIVTRNGIAAQLTAREYAVLHALMRRPGMLLSRAQLEARIYGWSGCVESNAVEFLLHGLRHKIGSEQIENVRGIGWRIACPKG